MPGPAVIIVDEGGFPVIPVDKNAPVVTIYEPPTDQEPKGTPITLVDDHGYPFIIEGFDPEMLALSSDDGSNLAGDSEELVETYNDGTPAP